MDFRFPIDDVKIELVGSIPELSNVTFQDHFTQLNQTEYTLHVPEIADFYVQNGNQIRIKPLCNPIDLNGIELYLNGSILGAILHQRKSLPLHGSSICQGNNGIIICGESGAGKSTISYALSTKDDVEFIADDVTSVSMRGFLSIDPLPGRIKLWEDTLNKFDIPISTEDQIRKDINKFFLTAENIKLSPVKLQLIVILARSNRNGITVEEIQGAEKFKAVWNEIYRKEYLNGMKESEKEYFNLISSICDSIPIYRVERHNDSDLSDLMKAVESIMKLS